MDAVKNEKLMERLKGSQYEGMVESFVSSDDEIEFDCQRCGKCCMHRDTAEDAIYISPLDIYNGAKELKMDVPSFAEKYIAFNIGPTSKVAVATLACNEYGACKLLEFEKSGLAKCRIHKAKPTICAIHPLGITHFDEDGPDKDSKIYAFVGGCEKSKTGTMVKVRDIASTVCGTDEEIDMALKVRVGWFDGLDWAFIRNTLSLSFALAVSRLDVISYNRISISNKTYKLSKSIANSLEKQIGKFDFALTLESISQTGQLLDAIHNKNMYESYYNYDTNKPFLEQCERNYHELVEFAKNVKNISDVYFKAITENMTPAQVEGVKRFIKEL